MTASLRGGAWIALAVALGVAAPAQAAITVTVDSGPPNPSAETSAGFTFHADGGAGAVSYACSLDAAALEGCSSPRSYARLHNGDHLFTVRATDSRGAQATAQYRWTVSDTTAPETSIDASPPDSTSSPDATLQFSADEADSTFRCSLDGAPPAGCTSPQSYAGLAPGSHTFSVAATDLNGNTDQTPATRTWTITSTSAGSSSQPTTAPPGTSAPPVVTAALALPIHGPFKYTGARFARAMARAGRTRPQLDDDHREQPARAPDAPIPSCGAPCQTTLPGEPLLPVGPAPVSTLWNPAKVNAGDLNIAASNKSLLVVSDGVNVATYDKAGSLITTDKNGDPLPYADPLPAATLFDPLLKKINTPQALNLPPPANATLADGKTLKYALDDVYDTRVLWDSYRSRFWIVSQARNSRARNGNPGVTAADLPYRRDKILAAVSKDADPRDGFTFWWWDAQPGDGSCTPATAPGACAAGYLPGDGADYFSIGISQHAFTEVEFVGNTGVPNHNWDQINVLRADKMAAGTCNTPQCGWGYENAPLLDGTGRPAQHSLSAVQQHGPSPDNRQYVLGTDSGNALDVYSFKPDDPWPPPLESERVAVNPFGGTIAWPQPPTANAENTTPAPVNLGTNLAPGQIIRAVYRGGQLYAVMPDCTQWPDQSSCSPSVHLWRLDPATATVSIDRPFGERGPGDSPTADVGYGWPWMDVNKDGTMAIGYQRSGPGVFPEARYSLRFAGDADLRPSHVIKAGSYPLGVPSSPGAKPTGRLDFTGASVDPFDDTGVWLLQAYAYRASAGSGAYQPVVARVLGQAYADVTVPSASTTLVATGKGANKHTVAPGGRLSIAGRVDNLGDGSARQVTISALLRPARGGAQHHLGDVSVGSLPGGRDARFRLHVRVPDGVAHGPYRVRLVAATRSRPQYDAGNDAADAGLLQVG